MAHSWITSVEHHAWLATQTDALLRFHARAAPDRAEGGFWWVDAAGEPIHAKGKQLWIAARHTYGFAVGALLGRPGYRPLAEAGVASLRSGALRDRANGGWFWAVAADGVAVDDTKQAYGHAFVVIAAAAAVVAGIDARDLLDDALTVLDERFWDEDERMFVDEWNRDFTVLDSYRGQNANMHLVEAMMLATEVTGEGRYLERAVSIAERLIRDVTARNDGRLPEHFAERWVFDPDYNSHDRDNLFRPYGSIIGHWLEWARLLIQLDAATGGAHPWLVPAARRFFDQGLAEGWDPRHSGFGYAVDWSGRVINSDRYHWVITEAIGAAVALYRATGDEETARWYERFWEYAAARHIDPADGSWVHQLDGDGEPVFTAWEGKPDLYHALQATLFARVPGRASLVVEIAAQ